jgi:hypothetical protein
VTYVVRIWEPPSDRPLPDSLDAADKLLHELDACRPSAEKPKFVALARRLTQRFPTADMWPVGDDGEEDEVPLDQVAWKDWSITDKIDDAVWNLGLNTGMLEDVRPFLIEEANALGLCMLDEQAGEAYLPGDKVLRMPGQQPAPANKDNEYDDVPRTKEMLGLVYERLAPLLAERGFKGKKRSLTFRRVFVDGWHELYVWSSVDRWPVHAEFAVTVTARFHAISNRVAAIAFPEKPPKDVEDLCTLLGPQRNWIEGDEPFLFPRTNQHYEVRSHLEIETVLDHLCSNLRLRLLPALDACQTVEDFDRALNPPPGVRSFFNGYLGGKENIVAAYLARNTNLEELCREYDPRLHKGRDRNPRVEKCIDYVRSHPLIDADG